MFRFILFSVNLLWDLLRVFKGLIWVGNYLRFDSLTFVWLFVWALKRTMIYAQVTELLDIRHFGADI